MVYYSAEIHIRDTGKEEEHMRSTVNKIGAVLLAAGILMLVTELVLTITVGTVAVPILIFSSILVNSVGITMLRHRKD